MTMSCVAYSDGKHRFDFREAATPLPEFVGLRSECVCGVAGWTASKPHERTERSTWPALDREAS